MEISKTFSFEASHILPKHPGKCSRLHGHSFKLLVAVQGSINPETGFVMDYADLSKVVRPIIDDLDHKHLGTWYHPMFDPKFIDDKYFVFNLPFDFYPSSEHLLVWIADQIGTKLDLFPAIHVEGHKWSRLELDETCT